MKETPNTRRDFIEKCVRSTGIAVAGILVWSGCGKKSDQAEAPQSDARDVNSCDDLSATGKDDVAIRTKLGYVEETPLPDNHCSNCNLYLPPHEGQHCGGCMLFKGPVFANAYCTYWAPKV